MKKRDVKDIALAMCYHSLDGSCTEFEGSPIDDTDEASEIRECIRLEREKLARRISDENKPLLEIFVVKDMVQYVQDKGGINA